ncbi:UbiA prenyltransferase family-domain-containing protein [Favolaschia claudopus]|uniref:UbiA prenyltransferase family-domain-containing protein n=1 Tax=Favolaschia claudopus TaxID=2862362 RepID=A0AAW0E852_9AGAR
MAAILSLVNAFCNIPQFIWTLILFTYTDFKTIVIPVTIFASVAAPVHSSRRFLYGVVWTWLHLLQVDVSNQYQTAVEDAINRPWRPLPGNRISQSSAAILRWLLIPLCVLASFPFGSRVVLSSLGLTALLVAHDELNWDKHWASKNIINTFGYMCFELGATRIMNANLQLDGTAVQALVFNALVVLTTIHSQDFSDMEGDAALGRKTFPIYAPNISRIVTPALLVAWSVLLGWAWSLGPTSLFVLYGLAGVVGCRFFLFRSRGYDANTYVIYNGWLLLTHLLPAHGRWGVMSL